ncbi:hypothetical protein GR925_38825 [Streptomyces sp. HUCO-GS316]|uniref:hypothetical protein n=1 Tax=Streptomyces sp. HUCO-GS316 TaxID=2692198 RepID=UPI00136F58F3|nr:hypothetical protein [Streptomyces sp. HUCO-GS316]MXM69189.1 hypothetical protein [Streptomyces sp. HUCO-GS316]
MYRIAIHRPGQNTEPRTGSTGGDVRQALWDLLRTTGFDIKDEHHSDLIAMAGQLRDKADIEGFGALLVEGHGAITVHDLDPVTV